MAALDFPASPTLNQTYTANGSTWLWDGSVWVSSNVLTVPSGGTGATTLTGVLKGNGASAFTAGTVSLTSEVSGTLTVASGGTGVTTSTGSGNNVLSTSPTLVTPTLGAASATSIATALGAVGTPSHTFTGDLNTGMWSPTADTLALSTGGSERLRVTSAGNVGVGTTTPQKKYVVSDGGAYGIELSPNESAVGFNRILNYDRVASLYRGVQHEAEYHSFQTGTSGITERMRVNSNGNVGIGTGGPTFPLEVNGEVRGTKFTSSAGSQSLANATNLTVLTLTGALPVRLFLVSINTNASAGDGMTVALVAVGTDGSGGASSTVTQLINGANTDITVANSAGTSTVSVQQTTGATQTISWSITRLM